jgi:hypothetical protein
VAVQAFQLHAGWRQAVETDAAIHGTENRIHAGITEHPAEVGDVIVQLHVVAEDDFQHGAHGLIEQAAVDGIVVVLQESADQFLRFFKVLQGKIDQQRSSSTVSWPQTVFSSNSIPISVRSP